MDVYSSTPTQKYDIPLNHLDYGYIQKCKNVKELEQIIKILRSGEEGIYPDLERCAEKQLESIKPNHLLLRTSRPVMQPSELGKDARVEIEEDMQAWSSEMKTKEEKLTDLTSTNKTKELPPVRGGASSISVDQSSQKSTEEQRHRERVAPRDYKEWEKVDIDAELEKVEKSDKEKKRTNVLRKPSKPQIPDTVDAKDISEEEKVLTADREKNKGNEAFQAGDFEEAILYYNRSLSLVQTVASHNNRAQAYIKMEKWDDALKDCNAVLKLEPGNMKALLRRGVAYHGRKELTNAKNDLQRVLHLEPANLRAQTVLEKVESALKEQKVKGRRMVIEDVEGSDDDDTEEEEVDAAPEKTDLEKPVLLEHQEKPQTLENSVEIDNNSDNGQIGNDKKIVENSNREKETSPVTVNGVHDAEFVNPKDENKEAELNKESNTVDVGSDVTNGTSETTENCDTSSPPDPTPPPPPPAPMPSKVEALKISGNDLFKIGQYSQAVCSYTQAIDQLEPLAEKSNHAANLSILYSNRAACRSKIGDCEGCVKDCNVALSLTPGAVKPLVRRACAYETMEKFRKAYVEYRQVLYIDRTVDVAHQGINRCTQMLQQLDGPRWREKLPQISPLTQISPSTLAPSASLPTKGPKPSSSPPKQPQPSAEELFEKFKTEGNALVGKGKFEEAAQYYTKCTELFPSRAVPYTNRALCHLRMNKPADVIQDCNRALHQEPQNVKALFRRAQAYKVQEQYQLSVEDLRLALKIDSKNVAARKELQIVVKYWQEQEAKRRQASAKKDKPRQTINIEEVDDSSEDEDELEKPATPKEQIGKGKRASTTTQTKKKKVPTATLR